VGVKELTVVVGVKELTVVVGVKLTSCVQASIKLS